MATLPDLDTSTTSFVAYWNALNHGVNDINPDDVLTDNNVQSYTLYDNGVIVQYAGANGRTFPVRVKEDGWFVAYIDRTEEANTGQNDSPPRGPWDVINGWTSYNSTGSITQNALERAINDLQASLGNSDNITYSTADVSLYNYEYTSATTVSMLGDAYSENGNDRTTTHTARFSYTSSTTLEWAFSTGAAYFNASGGGNGSGESAWSDGTQITYAEYTGSDNYGSSDVHYGTLELLSSGRISQSATNYGHDLTVSTNQYSGTAYANGHVLIMWS